jgi:hypothetical protein
MNSKRISTNSKMELRRLLRKKTERLYEIRMIAQNMKEEHNKEMKNNQSENLEVKSTLN